MSLLGRLSALLDGHKASRLSSKINDLVDDYYMTRGLNRPGTASSRKRTHEGGSDENDPSKRAKGSSNGAAPAPAAGVAAQDTTPMANAAPGGGAPMTAEQIRAMMSNARKEILVRPGQQQQ